MDSLLLRSFPNAPSIATGSYAPKLLRFQWPRLNHQYCKGVEGRSTYQEFNRKYIVKAVSEQSFESEYEPHTFDRKSNLDSIKKFLDVFYRFCRPYSFVTTVLSTISVSLLAVEKLSSISPLFFIGLLEAVVVALLMHIYAVGVNQLADVEIDKINKPYLPLASGEYSYGTGVIITTSFLILSIWFSLIVGSWPLFWTVVGNSLITTAYSINLPLLRWKNSAVLAAMSIVGMQAIVPQVGFFFHMQTHVYKKPVVFPRPLIFAVAFMIFFFIVVALLKDIPDTEGDRKHGVQSFSVLSGPKPVFWTSISLLGIAYGVALFVGATSPYLWSKIITGLGHIVLASYLWYHAKSVDVNSKTSTTSFYFVIWKLICAEYFLIPFVR